MSISRVNEVVLGLLAIFWGIVFVLPGDLFAGLERYQFFNNYAPDWLWGAILMIFGLLIIPPAAPILRKIAHWGLCTLWLGMAMLSMLAVISPPSLLFTSLFVVVAIFHATKFFRLSHLQVVDL